MIERLIKMIWVKKDETVRIRKKKRLQQYQDAIDAGRSETGR